MTTAPRQEMSASTSVGLDVLRIVAALVVVVFHASGQWLTSYPAAHSALGKMSHAAVVIFFVISGYVIAFTTATNNRGARRYAVARLSRLYAVLVPALLLTALVEVVVHGDAALTARYVREHAGLRYVMSALFLNESGSLSAAPPLNSPLWSLSYEFWYYILFGIWCYGSGRRWARWALLAAGVVAGPKILLLLPIWLFGVAAYRLPRNRLSAGVAWLLVGSLFGVLAVAVAYLPALPMTVGDQPLFMAGQFLTDWLVGGICALAIWCLPAGPGLEGRSWSKSLRAIADLSFPIYTLHFPLLVLWRVLFGLQANDFGQLGVATATVIFLAVAIGLLLEKQRPQWVRLFAWASDAVSQKPSGR
ncbi:acyltransferase family protein [Hymenobacter negativus]|uniref:Acyltransferase n=1 Tax=Hymenobacter negativus TaxID=2795026 RepID=A0ABS3QA44_9BACT|nr:acyltransferase [Hymenobacter negativus]MBO2008115.1 acyltransferase [Hymenobacter negativus]